MQVRELPISGAWAFLPEIHKDDRGVFLESLTQTSILASLGFRMDIQQMNISVSGRGTIRGIHFADVPPGQAKYVQCLDGQILDVIVDIRVGSPTFGTWNALELDSDSRQALYIAEGLGHAFCALTEKATVGYLCSQAYAPAREHGVDPMDTAIGIEWPTGVSVSLSDRDASAPSLHEAQESGLLPQWTACQEYYNSLQAAESS